MQEYPVKPPSQVDGLMGIPRALLHELIEKTLFAVGENDARYVLNGVLLERNSVGGQKQQIRLVGTDGHRLALIERQFDPTAGSSTGPGDAIQGVIIPKKTLIEMKKILDEEGADPELGFAKNQMIFRQGDLLLLSRLMEGTYPNYQQVIPKENEKQILVTKRSLEAALRRVSLLSREKTNAVKFQIGAGKICLSSSNPEMGEAKEDLPVPYKGDSVVAGFNARYLLDVLGAIQGEEAQFEFKDSLSPCLVREPEDKDYLCVVMPMRV